MQMRAKNVDLHHQTGKAGIGTQVTLLVYAAIFSATVANDAGVGAPEKNEADLLVYC